MIPFDVKPAFGSGEEMVRFLVEDEVRSWALGLGQSVPDCVFHTSGPVLQRNPNGIGLQVQSFLAHLPAAPVYPKSFSLTVGLASICVVLDVPFDQKAAKAWNGALAGEAFAELVNAKTTQV